MAAVTVPMPHLEYMFWSRHGLDYTFGGDLPLASVHEVRVSLDHTGAPSVWVTGRMLKKDGTPGPRRCSQADLNTPQPDWLRQLLVDALPRLGVADVLHFERDETVGPVTETPLPPAAQCSACWLVATKQDHRWPGLVHDCVPEGDK